MRRTMMTLAALLLAAAAFGATKPQPAPAAKPEIECPLCPPGYYSSGPPLCRCVGGQ
jgi:hypothetical protein